MIRTLHVKSCINVTGSLCFNDDDDDEQHQFCRHKQKRQEWKQFDGVFEVGVLFIPYHRINEKKNRCILSEFLWHTTEMDRIWRKVSSFLSFRLHALFSEIPIFARFSAILRHGQRNAKNLFTYLTKVKVSTRQQIWPNGNVNECHNAKKQHHNTNVSFGSVCRIMAWWYTHNLILYTTTVRVVRHWLPTISIIYRL